MKFSTFSNLAKAKLLLSFSFICFAFSLSAQSTDLVIIGSSFSNKVSLKASLPVTVISMEVSYSSELLSGLRDKLEKYPTLENVHLFSETTQSAITLGNDVFDRTTLETYTNILDEIGDSREDGDVKFFIYSCSLANNINGISLLNSLGEKTKCNILSATNCGSINEEDFTFDFSSTNNIVPTTSIFH